MSFAFAAEGVVASFEVTPRYALRYAAAIALFSMSMHYLVSGRKEASPRKMIVGAVLALASLFFL